MSIEFDEKGKIFTDLITKVAVRAVIQTTSQLIRGHVHVRQGERLKDELDRDELFLAVTDATITGQDGQPMFETPFLAVGRSQIVWVMPEEEDSISRDA